MTFTEAETKLAKLASVHGDCHAIQFERITFSSEHVETKCMLYIGKRGWYSGRTWDEAFISLDKALNPKNAIEQSPDEVEA